jgi:hypothetical protein
MIFNTNTSGYPVITAFISSVIFSIVIYLSVKLYYFIKTLNERLEQCERTIEDLENTIYKKDEYEADIDDEIVEFLRNNDEKIYNLEKMVEQLRERIKVKTI